MQKTDDSIVDERVLAANGGHGRSSYACNSLFQMRINAELRPVLHSSVVQATRAILDNESESLRRGFRVADTGCATGANTYMAVDLIVRTARQCFRSCPIESVPEFQAYFCDLPSNDFNMLLSNLPPLTRDDTFPLSHSTDYPLSRSYFAAAICGSHHTQLLPKGSLHFCHSSNALHWLSTVPREVKDRNSKAWNGGHIYISSEEVAEAYLKQYFTDFAAYLKARADELVHGGGLPMALLARHSPEPIKQDGIGSFIRQMELPLKDMLQQGMIEESVLDRFNVPVFGPTLEEVEKVVDKEKSFEKKEVRLLRGFPQQTMTEVKDGEEHEFGESEEMRYRSIIESMVSEVLEWKTD
eukprot:TRINITY_DN1899_c0_g1_i5.p1 TRINITY_DN1899_c0_g1~~TRINITY_DN1899_c0_g1_i5.p1  ORF type:complete len:355 (-),score=15.92 TRINITY_DN1899_c0_g1_i5:262-1326(-)